MSDKKPRKTASRLKISPQLIDGGELKFNSKTGEAYYLKDGEELPAHFSSKELYHDKNDNKGRKAIAKIATSAGTGSLIDEYEFMSMHDIVFIIDTNYTEFKDDDLHISCFIQLSVIDQKVEYFLDVRDGLGYFLFLNITNKHPEKVGWKTLIEQPAIQTAIKEDKKILLIVDSYLDELGQYNTQELPLIGNYYLPENISLMYASSDKSGGFSNRLIKVADKEANILKEAILKNIFSPTLRSSEDHNYKNFQFIDKPEFSIKPNIVSKEEITTEANVPAEIWGINKDKDGKEIRTLIGRTIINKTEEKQTNETSN